MSVSFIIISSLPTKGMKSMGNVGLLKYKKYTIIEKHIEYILHNYNSAEIVVVGGFEHRKMQKILEQYNRVKYISHELSTTSNETQSLCEALKAIKYNKAIVINQNCMFAKNFWSKINTRVHKSFLVVNRHKEFTTNIGAIVDGDTLQHMFFNLPIKSTNIYCLNKKHIEYAKQICTEKLYSTYMFEFINLLNNYDKFTIQDVNTKKHIIIDSVDNYKKAKDI